MTSLAGGTCAIGLYMLPPDLHNLRLASAHVKPGAFQHTSVISVKFSAEDCIVKKCGDLVEIYLGKAVTDAPGVTIPNIAIKRIRLDRKDDNIRHNVLSILALAEHKWSTLNHPNICAIWSLTSSDEPVAAVAMPWFGNGNIIDFMRQNPGINKLVFVKQVASAVAYIHATGEVHGNIIPMNIMITDDGRPCLTDTGLKSRLSKAINNGTCPIPSGWMYKAPEELLFEYDPASFLPTRAMDIYAFASTVYVILTSKPLIPIKPYGRGLMQIISHGHVLDQPTEMSWTLWVLLKKCWSYSPADRPSMVIVEAALEIN